MRYQVLAATSMKIAVFWDVASCSLVETAYQGIAGQITRGNIPEGSHLLHTMFAGEAK
jgi:hypothetical protein